MGEENISALSIKLSVFVWGSKVVHVPFLFHLKVSESLKIGLQ